MRQRQATRLWSLVWTAALTIGLITVVPEAAYAADASGLDRPITIPALQEWTAADGVFEATSDTRIVLHTEDAAVLGDVAETFAADLRAIDDQIGNEIVLSDDEIGAHDILLEIDPEVVREEGYTLRVGEGIIVGATSESGALYGTRTVLQLLSQDLEVPAGEANDWPLYEDRGLMLDLGRMHLDYDWIAAQIRNMSYLKMNVLHLHLTDDQGWRIESDLGLQSEEYLTKTEVTDLIALADRYGIEVIPEIDMPSHLGKLLEQYPQFQLVSPDGTAPEGRLDYSIPEARELLFTIVDEYIDLFPGQFWHMGSDEYLGNTQYADYPQLLKYAQEVVGPEATAKDGSIALVNEMNAHVKSRGKIMRVWNDMLGPGTTIEVDNDVVIQWWTDADAEDVLGPNGPFSPQTLLDKGYEVSNHSLLPTYDYPPGGQTPQIYIDYMYDSWMANEFYGYLYQDLGAGEYKMYVPMKTVAPDAPGHRGAMLNMWNSGGTWTADEGAASIFPRMRIMAQKTWASPQHASDWETFEPLIETTGKVPEFVLELSSETWAAPATGAQTRVSVASNDVRTSQSSASWLSAKVVPGGLEVTAEDNNAKEPRSGTITVVAGDLTSALEVVQEAAPVIPPDPEPTGGLPTSSRPTSSPSTLVDLAPVVTGVGSERPTGIAAAPRSELASTGSNVFVLAVAGLALSVIGCVAALRARRRNTV